MTYKEKLYLEESTNEELDADYTMKHLTPCECYGAEDGTEWNDKVEPDTTISIFRVINGIYKSDVYVATLEIEDVFQSTEIDQFCEDNNCYYNNEDTVLYCNDTHVALYHIK